MGMLEATHHSFFKLGSFRAVILVGLIRKQHLLADLLNKLLSEFIHAHARTLVKEAELN